MSMVCTHCKSDRVVPIEKWWVAGSEPKGNKCMDCGSTADSSDFRAFRYDPKQVFNNETDRALKKYCNYLMRKIIRPALSRYKWYIDYGMGSVVIYNNNDKEIDWRTRAAKNLEKKCDEAIRGTILQGCRWSVWEIVSCGLGEANGKFHWNTKIDPIE